MSSSSSAEADKVQTDVLSQAREACYKARDAFYLCVEKHSSDKATEIASVGLLYPRDCRKYRAAFENSCRPSWVKHFDRQYCSKKRVERFLDDNDSDSRRGPFTLPHRPTTFPSSSS